MLFITIVQVNRIEKKLEKNLKIFIFEIFFLFNSLLKLLKNTNMLTYYCVT